MDASPAPDATLTPEQRTAFGSARKKAATLLRNRYRSYFLAREAYTKLFKHDGGMRRVSTETRALIRLVQAWSRREYTAIPWKPLLYATAALVYFVSPADLIPDLLPGLGFLDDVAVVTAVIRAIQNELEAFEAWEQAQHTSALTAPTS